MTVERPSQATRQDVAIVTGPSGAGRTTTIHALEDLGFEAIDNLPLNLVGRLFQGETPSRPLAIGADPRTRDFSAEGLLAVLDRLGQDERLNVSLVYVDCSTDKLLQRYSETRRRHPSAPQETPLAGIERERQLLSALVGRADIMIDTSAMSPHECKDEVGRWFSRASAVDLAVSVQSFSFKRGTPRSADMVLDCRFLKNPHWAPELRALTGQDEAVAQYVADDPLYAPFFERAIDLVRLLLPAYKAEGKAYFTLAFGCTGGRHRSVCVAQAAAFELAQAGWRVSIRHRELEQASGGVMLKDLVKM